MKAVSALLTILKEDGHTNRYADRMASLKEYEALLRLPDFLEMEKQYTA